MEVVIAAAAAALPSMLMPGGKRKGSATNLRQTGLRQKGQRGGEGGELEKAIDYRYLCWCLYRPINTRTTQGFFQCYADVFDTHADHGKV